MAHPLKSPIRSALQSARASSAPHRAVRPGAQGLVQADHRPQAVAQRRLHDAVQHSARVLDQAASQPVVQAQQGLPHTTGLPAALRSGIESLSGLAMDDVKVHHNASSPAQLNALALAQGRDIHLAPGQEQHLPHEAWHVVQQAQGRVRPMLPLRGGVAVNNDAALEHEADLMGLRALQAPGGPGPAPALAPATTGLTAARPAAPVVQRQRLEIAKPPKPLTVADLVTAVAAHMAEIKQVLNGSAEDLKGGFLDEQAVALVQKLAQDLAENLQKIQALGLADDRAFTEDDLAQPTTAEARAMRAVVLPLARMRQPLNKSLADYTAWLQDQAALTPKAYEHQDHSDKLARQDEERKQAQKARAALRKPGLGNKWKEYRDKLSYATNKQTLFNQFVPAGSETIEKSLRSGNILDAVYHQGKAFWMSDLKRYKLDDTVGKTKMAYTFSAAGAKSLMEDYLICGSGDFADDNDEKYAGETAHPYYTIWKPNEVGAYGLGAERLKELAPSVVKIEAFTVDGKPVKLK